MQRRRAKIFGRQRDCRDIFIQIYSIAIVPKAKLPGARRLRSSVESIDLSPASRFSRLQDKLPGSAVKIQRALCEFAGHVLRE